MANGLIGALTGPVAQGARQSFSQEFLQGVQGIEQKKQQIAARKQQEAQQTDQALQKGLTIFNALDKAGADDATKQQAWKTHVSPHIDEVDKGVQDVNQLKQITKILEQRQQLGPESAFEAIRAINPVTGEPEEAPQPQMGLQAPEALIQPEAGMLEQPEGEFVPTFKAEDVKGGSEVQSSKILPGGLTQLVFRDGSVKVVPATEANKALVIQAEERGASLQGLRAGERDAAKVAIGKGKEFFEKAENTQDNIDNLNEGIRLLDEGAQTGAVTRLFPSIKSASVQLKNLQSRLGLDVLRNTTFGALSEKELAFALSTALPEGLNEPQLRDWLTDKRDAQIKLFNYMRDAAQFLLTPGNSASDFLTMQKVNQRATGATRRCEQFRPEGQPPQSAQPQAVAPDQVGRFTIKVK
jgi:hypothetical protein